MNHKVQISKFIYRQLSLIQERRLGIDLFRTESQSALGHEVDGENGHYVATRNYEIRKVLALAGARSSDSIIDFGSGKGAGLISFCRYGLKRVCGVELSPRLCEIAEANLQKLRISNAVVLNRDATSLTKELDSFNIFYFYNPFSGSVFQQVVDNIVSSVGREPRSAILIYNHPLPAERRMIENSGCFELIGTYKSFFFETEYLIYRHKLT